MDIKRTLPQSRFLRVFMRQLYAIKYPFQTRKLDYGLQFAKSVFGLLPLCEYIRKIILFTIFQVLMKSITSSEEGEYLSSFPSR